MDALESAAGAAKRAAEEAAADSHAAEQRLVSLTTNMRTELLKEMAALRQELRSARDREAVMKAALLLCFCLTALSFLWTSYFNYSQRQVALPERMKHPSHATMTKAKDGCAVSQSGHRTRGLEPEHGGAGRLSTALQVMEASATEDTAASALTHVRSPRTSGGPSLIPEPLTSVGQGRANAAATGKGPGKRKPVVMPPGSGTDQMRPTASSSSSKAPPLSPAHGKGAFDGSKVRRIPDDGAGRGVEGCQGDSAVSMLKPTSGRFSTLPRGAFIFVTGGFLMAAGLSFSHSLGDSNTENVGIVEWLSSALGGWKL